MNYWSGHLVPESSQLLLPNPLPPLHLCQHPVVHNYHHGDHDGGDDEDRHDPFPVGSYHPSISANTLVCNMVFVGTVIMMVVVAKKNLMHNCYYGES